MIVEFMGISGVGKTTIAKQYYKMLLRKKKNVIWIGYELYVLNGWIIRNTKKGFWVLAYLLRHPFWCVNLCKLLRDYSNLNIKEYVRLIFNGIFLKKVYVKNKPSNDVYIYDEGVIQYIWAIYLRIGGIPQIKNIKEIVKLFGIPDRLIIIQSESEIIQERLLKRNVKSKIMESNNLLNKIEEMQIIQKHIIYLLVQDGIIRKEDLRIINN